MKLNFHSRTWHIWVSIILSLPILIVAATAVFISHKKALGTDEVAVAADWLPGYQVVAGKAPWMEIRSSLTTTGGDTYVGTQNGLFRFRGNTLVAVEELANTQIRGLAEAAWGKVVAAKNGIWVEKDGVWQRAVKGDAWNASTRPDGTVAVTLKDKGLMVSGDGRLWRPDVSVSAALAAMPAGASAEPITLAKLVLDLHTGKAFFGKEGEWIWIDIVGIALCLLGLTGVYMWWRGQRRKAALTGA